MPLPPLKLGLVVRYEYLWARRASQADTADKDHPACVIGTYYNVAAKADMVQPDQGAIRGAIPCQKSPAGETLKLLSNRQHIRP